MHESESPLSAQSASHTHDADPFSSENDPFADQILLEVPDHQKYRWAVSWSDLMMTMFVMFAVMYIYQSGHREFAFKPETEPIHTSRQGSRKVTRTADEQIPSDVLDTTRNAVHEDFIQDFSSVEFVKDKAIRISIASDLLFDLGKADLKAAATYQLKQIARAVNQSNLAINVAGHTDITPIYSERYPTNWELSAARAVTVARFMIETCGVDESRFFLTAHAYHQPLRSNDTRQNRALNRRVEIILTKERPDPREIRTIEIK